MTEDVTVTCPSCGAVLQVGSWPWCPHGRGTAAVERDEIPGGITCENYGPNPVTFYSHSERRAYMKAHGLHEIEKFCPMPGTDIDPQGIPNPAGYVDKQTLANGIALLTRGAGVEKEWDPKEAGVLVNEFKGEITGRDVRAFETGDTRRLSRVGRRTNGGR